MNLRWVVPCVASLFIACQAGGPDDDGSSTNADSGESDETVSADVTNGEEGSSDESGTGGDGDGDGDGEGDLVDCGELPSCEEAGSLCFTLEAPAGFDANVVKAGGGLYPPDTPLPPAGPPTTILPFVESGLCLADGVPMHMRYTAVEYDPDITPGDQVLYMAVYVEGGGSIFPMSGVDYIATHTIAVDGAGMTVPEVLVLGLAP